MVTMGSILTNAQVAQLAVDNGFPASNRTGLIVCVAIANAESSRNTKAVNNNTNATRDSGLWQINDVHKDKLPGQDRFDPNVNAKLMLMISANGTNWQPWSTYNNGAYQRFMSEVTADIGNVEFKPGDIQNFAPTDLIPGSEAVSKVTEFVKMLLEPATWIRIGKAVLGGFLVALGLIMMLKDSSRVKTALRAGITVASKGKLAPVVNEAA